MMILDSRETGMLSELQRYDVEVVEMTLNSADLRFTGNGENGECLIGCERKKLGDLIGCMKDRRLAGRQLRELWQEHDYVFLMIEGIFRPGPGGVIEHLRGREWVPYFSPRDKYAVSYRQLAAYINSLTLRSRSIHHEPLRVIRTFSAQHTAAEYVALYHWFTDKEWSEHHAHDQIYCVEAKRENGRRIGMLPETVTTLWKMAAQLPGVDRKAELVAKHFGTVKAMANASVEDWLQIKSDQLTKSGRRRSGIGKETAIAAVKAITEVGG